MTKRSFSRGFALMSLCITAACHATHEPAGPVASEMDGQTQAADSATQTGSSRTRTGSADATTPTTSASAATKAEAGSTSSSSDAGVTTHDSSAAGKGGSGTQTASAGAASATVTDAGLDAQTGHPDRDASPATSNVPGVGPAQDKPLGYGQKTSGGGTTPAQSAGTLAELQAAVDAYSGSGGLVLEYTGKFDFGRITDPCVQHTLPSQKLEIKKKGDITIVGKDGSAANFGIHIAATATNIIIRNMTIGLTPGGSDSDMISVEGMSSGAPRDIWIDHNELFSSLADCPGAGDTAFDGMIDIKKGADNVTVSYNYMHDHHKVSLNGYSDSDTQTRHVTFHHNFFEHVGSRTPLQRGGFSHVLNNQFSKVLVSAINVRMKGYALIEGNFFQDVVNPVTSRDSKQIGYWELRDNNLATAADVAPGNRAGITWSDGHKGTVNATQWMTTAKFPEPLGYTYSADPYTCVRDGLRAVVGAGKQLATLTCQR